MEAAPSTRQSGLDADEALRMSEAMLMTLYGVDNYKRWMGLKRRLGFRYEMEFVSWMLDHVETCEASGGGGRVKKKKAVIIINTRPDLTAATPPAHDGTGTTQPGGEAPWYHPHAEGTKCSWDIKQDEVGLEIDSFDDAAEENLSFEDEDADCLDYRESADATGGIRRRKVPPKRNRGNERPTASVRKRIHACSYCGKAFHNTGHYREHVSMVHEKSLYPPVSCSQCQFRSRRPRDLAVHVIEKHGGTSEHRCVACGKYAVSERALGAHRSRRCEVVRRAARRAARRAVANGLHHHACSYCGEAFLNTTDYRRHVAAVHETWKIPV